MIFQSTELKPDKMKAKCYLSNRTVLAGYILIPTIEIDYINFPDSHKVLSFTIAWLRFSAAIYFYKYY